VGVSSTTAIGRPCYPPTAHLGDFSGPEFQRTALLLQYEGLGDADWAVDLATWQATR